MEAANTLPPASPRGAKVLPDSPPRDGAATKSVRFKDPSSSDVSSHCASSSSSAFPHSSLKARQGSGTSGTSRLLALVEAGDATAAKELLATGAVDVRARDAAGHSLLWRLIAAGQMELALQLLERFPFTAEAGADAAELHPTQRDTLLHLLCRASPFKAEAAELLKRASMRLALGPLLTSRNAAGESFFDVAAAAANFWVLRFTLANFPAAMKTLLPGGTGCPPPLQALAKRLPRPPSPAVPEMERWPQHLDFARSLAPDPSTGLPPYADLAFEVGEEPAGGMMARTESRSLLPAHAAVMAAQSPVLLEELKSRGREVLPGHESVQVLMFRVDARISKEAWKGVMHFCYTGLLKNGLPAEDRKLIELLRACQVYQLPAALFEPVQAQLIPLLGSCKHHALLEVFRISEADSRLVACQEASAYWLLQGAHEVHASMEPSEAAAFLRRVLKAVEAAVFK